MHVQVECSSLTGESDLVPATVDSKSDIPEHAHCLVFMSTLCMNGEGRGIVIRTGALMMLTVCLPTIYKEAGGRATRDAIYSRPQTAPYQPA